jgi:hypothetical protein
MLIRTTKTAKDKNDINIRVSWEESMNLAIASLSGFFGPKNKKRKIKPAPPNVKSDMKTMRILDKKRRRFIVMFPSSALYYNISIKQ